MLPRILFLHHTAIIGGAELHLLSVAHHFRATSKVVLFGDGPFRELLEKNGVAVEIFPSSWAASGVRGGAPRFNARNVAQVLRLAWRTARRTREIDLIYSNSPRAFFIAALARLVRRVPLLWIMHDLLSEKHFNRRGAQLIVRVANHSVSRVLADSHAIADAFQAAGGRADRMRIVHCGVETSLPPASIESADSRTPTVGVFGRITPWKGQEIVLRALAKIHSIAAILVGEEEDAVYAKKLHALTEELHIAERIHFLGFRADAAQLMRTVDCVVHASIDPEPFGLVLVEGMLAGRPVIATRGGATAEIIEDGVSGILVTPGDVDELSRAILRIFSDPKEARRLVQNGLARARTLFTKERMLQEIEESVNEIARPR